MHATESVNETNIPRTRIRKDAGAQPRDALQQETVDRWCNSFYHISRERMKDRTTFLASPGELNMVKSARDSSPGSLHGTRQ